MTIDALNLDTLMAVERQGWDALCGGTGSDFYGDLMSADAMMVLVNGMVLDREAVVASLNEAPAWDEYDLTEARMIPLGDHAAALVYRATARRGSEPHFQALMASTYVLDDGKLRLGLYQQTTLTH